MSEFIGSFSLVICIAGGIQGIILLAVLNRLFREKNVDRKWLLIFIALLTITLLGRILYLFPNNIDIRIPVLTDAVLFAFGPLYYFFLQSVFIDTSVTKKKKTNHWIHFIPLIIHVIVTIPIFFLPLSSYVERMHTGEIYYYYLVIMIVAFLHNIIYWIKSAQHIKKMEHQFGQKVKFLAGYVYMIKWWYLVVLVCFGSMIVLYLIDFGLASFGYQITWVAASWMGYGLGYYLLLRPETFGDMVVKMRNQGVRDEREQRQIEDLAQKLKEQLEVKRIFLDPEISLLGLAKILETNNVMLSKTINQHFEVGFYDLINKYRVEEFIRLVKDPDNSHFTFFALAIQAGFNSKTSFNKYFKKVTKQTPKEYFRQLKVA